MKLGKKELEKLTEKATVDCYDDYECLVVGEEVEIVGVEQEGNRIQVVCTRNTRKYIIDISNIEYDSRRVKGWEWIEVYKEWAKYI